MKKTFLMSAKFCVSGALLYVLLADLQWSRILDALAGLPPWILALMLGVYLLAQLLSCLRWRLICAALGLSATWRYLMSLYFIGMFCNLFLPTGVGGDAVKSIALGRASHSHIKAAQSILFDRFSGLVALCLLAAAALLFVHAGITWIRPLVLTVTLSGLGVMLFLPALIRLLSGPWPQCGQYLTPVARLYHEPRRFLLMFFLAVMIQGLGIVLVAGLGESLGIRLSLSYYVVYWTLITLLTLLPVSINGLGVREAGFVYFFGLEGVPEALSLTLSLLIFAIQACVALFGFYPLFYSMHKKRLRRNQHIMFLKKDLTFKKPVLQRPQVEYTESTRK